MDVNENNPEPSGNMYEIFGINELVGRATDLSTLLKLYQRHGNFNHPQVCFDFGRALSIMGDKITAKDALLKGAGYGLKYPCVLYDNAMIDSVGQCMFDLVTQYSIRNVQVAINITCLSYIYLSRCIELYPREAHDSYRSRGILFRHHNYNMLPHSIISEYLGPAFLLQPFVISDFFFAAAAKNSPFKQKALQSAREEHAWLEDISVGGRNADEYSLEEMAGVGEARHAMLFETLEKEYQNGKFNTSIDELHQLNR